MNKLLITLAAAAAVSLSACAQTKGKLHMEATRTLVTYFSATGTTAQAAHILAEVTGATLHEIVPQDAYTSADLNWHDAQSRSSVEMNNPHARPALKEPETDLSNYDVIFIGYPIWWDQAPRVINAFIDNNDLKGKILIPFATSGGSGIERSIQVLQKTYPDLKWHKGRLLNHAGKDDIRKWIESL